MHTSRVVVCLLIASGFLSACATHGADQGPATPSGFAKSLASMQAVDAAGASAPLAPGASAPLAPGASAPLAPGATDTLHADGAADRVVGADAEGLVVAEADGSGARHLDSGMNRSGFDLAVAARGLRADGGDLRWDLLAALSRIPEAQLSVLSIHDGDGELLHEEVLRESCTSLQWSALETPELMLACAERTWRYTPGPAGEPVLGAADFQRSGRAFGPLSFGDSRARVSAALQLRGAECATSRCSLWAVELDERDFMLAPGYRNEMLERVTLFGPRRSRPQWWTKVRGDWSALATRFGGDAATKEANFPPVQTIAEKPLHDGWTFAVTHRPQRSDMQTLIGVYRNENGNADGFGAIAILAPPAAPANAASTAPAADTVAVPAAPAD